MCLVLNPHQREAASTTTTKCFSRPFRAGAPSRIRCRISCWWNIAFAQILFPSSLQFGRIRLRFKLCYCCYASGYPASDSQLTECGTMTLTTTSTTDACTLYAFFFNFFFLGLTEGTQFSLLAQQICTFIIRFHLFVTIVTVYSSVELRTQSTTNRECDLWYHHYPSDFYLIFRLRPGRKTTSCHAMIHHCYSWRLIFPFLHYALTKQNSPLIHT